MTGIRRRFVDAFEIAAVVYDAWARREDEFADFVKLARCEHIVGATHVGFVIILEASPRADFSCAVDVGVDVFHGIDNTIQIADVADALFDFEFVKRRMSVAIDGANGMSRRDESCLRTP